MIGVRVSIQDGVEAVDAEAQRLVTKIRLCIDEPAMRAEANEDGRAQPLVARVRRLAHLATAADHGDTDAGAGSKHEDGRGIEIVQHVVKARGARQTWCLFRHRPGWW